MRIANTVQVGFYLSQTVTRLVDLPGQHLLEVFEFHLQILTENVLREVAEITFQSIAEIAMDLLILSLCLR